MKQKRDPLQTFFYFTLALAVIVVFVGIAHLTSC